MQVDTKAFYVGVDMGGGKKAEYPGVRELQPAPNCVTMTDCRIFCLMTVFGVHASFVADGSNGLLRRWQGEGVPGKAMP